MYGQTHIKEQTLYMETDVHLFSYLAIYETVTGTKSTAQPDRPKTQMTTYIEREYLEDRKEKRVYIKRKF
jgi:hypothetical protein